MTKRIVIISILCIIMVISGCIDSTTVISVKKDGSGIITETLYFNSSIKDMMEGMMAQFGENDEDNESDDDPLKIEEYKEKAHKLGKGVKFVSADEVTKEDGSSGVKIVYSFTDIRNLTISVQPDSPMGDSMGNTEESSEDVEDLITFDFIKGSTPKLIILMPHKADSEEDAAETGNETDMEQPDETMDFASAGMEMMKPFFEGMRISVRIELLDGKIKKTNAAHVENHEGKDTITLIEMEMSEILKDDENLKKFSALDKIKDPAVALQKMKDLPGFKVETSERIEVTFK